VVIRNWNSTVPVTRGQLLGFITQVVKGIKTTSSDMYPWFSIFIKKSNNCPSNCILLTGSFMKMVSSLKFF
jgi:hypothetical protein